MKHRETHLDLLRLLATAAVLIVHIAGTEVYNLPGNDPRWQQIVFICSLMTWQVPSFVMISGRFFLDPDRPMNGRKIWRAILRLVIAFLFWGIVYTVYFCFSGAFDGLSAAGIFMEFLAGPFHFWFLFMIAALYAITPLLRSFITNKKLTEYFLLLFFIYELLSVYGVRLPYAGSAIETFCNHTAFHFAVGYVGYFVMGYYLAKYPLSDRIEIILYCLLPFLLLGSAFANTAYCIRVGEFHAQYTQYLNPNIIVIAATIYTFFVKRLSRLRLRPRAEYWISKLSEWSFGVYLSHVLVLSAIRWLGLTPLSGPIPVMFIVLLFLGLLGSNLLVCLLRKLPLIGKKIT